VHGWATLIWSRKSYKLEERSRVLRYNL